MPEMQLAMPFALTAFTDLTVAYERGLQFTRIDQGDGPVLIPAVRVVTKPRAKTYPARKMTPPEVAPEQEYMQFEVRTRGHARRGIENINFNQEHRQTSGKPRKAPAKGRILSAIDPSLFEKEAS